MSDMHTDTDTSATRKPFQPQVQVIKDSLGRKLNVKKLDALAELDLIEAAGPKNAANARWMMMVTFAACVRDIDDVAMFFPRDMHTARRAVELVGSEGIRAVMELMAEEEAALNPEGADKAVLGTAKN